MQSNNYYNYHWNITDITVNMKITVIYCQRITGWVSEVKFIGLCMIEVIFVTLLKKLLDYWITEITDVFKVTAK